MRRILSTAVRPHALRVCTAALSALIPGLAAFAQYGPIDPFDSATAALRQSLFQANDGQQHAAMIALRELRDPQVRPLLQALLRGEDLSLRVDSVLGLAAIDPARKVDPTLIESLPRAADRETAVAAAIALEFADLNRIEQMLAWPGLDPSLRLLMACEQRRLGGEPDRAELMQWTNSRSPELAAVALALLLDIGALEASEAEARVRTMIAELPPKLRAEAVAQVAERCSIYALRGAASFVATLVSLPDVGGDARSRALGSLLVLDAPTGYPVFAQSLDADRSQLALMRHAAILLAAGVRAPASEWNRVRNGDQLLEAIADAGTALAQSDDAAAAKRLTQLKHRITLNAAVEGARRLGTSFDRALGLECLAILEENPRGLGPLLAPVMRALSRLAIVAPEELKLALERAQGRPELQDQCSSFWLRRGRAKQPLSRARIADGRRDLAKHSSRFSLLAPRTRSMSPNSRRSQPWRAALYKSTPPCDFKRRGSGSVTPTELMPPWRILLESLRRVLSKSWTLIRRRSDKPIQFSGVM